MLTDQQKTMVQDAVQAASMEWKSAFNAGDAAGCTALYEDSAVMHARGFGTFTGTTEILGFWQKMIDEGFSEVEYIDPVIEIVDEKSAVLSSNWKMNKARGVIHKEFWVLQNDGKAKLREDDFEAKG